MSILVFVSIKIEKKNKETEFSVDYSGVITSIKYDPKTIPFITIDNGLEHYLGNYPIRERDNLEVGDSIIKKRNDEILKHYKKYENGYYLYETYKISK